MTRDDHHADLTPRPSCAGAERRTEPRLPCGPARVCRVLVRPSFRTHHALLENLSRRGIGLVLPFRLRRGMLLAVQLPRPRWGVSYIRSARVVHVRPCPEGGWLHGCTLGRPLGEEEITDLT